MKAWSTLYPTLSEASDNIYLAMERGEQVVGTVLTDAVVMFSTRSIHPQTLRFLLTKYAGWTCHKVSVPTSQGIRHAITVYPSDKE